MTANLRLKLKLIGLLTIWSPISMAITSVPCHTNSLTKNSSQIIDIAYFGSKDPRMKIKEFAKSQGLSEKEVIKQFSGVGTIHCDGSMFSAQIVGNNSTVVTAAHGFYNDDCSQLDVNNCYFETYFKPKQKFTIKSSTSIINPCTHNSNTPNTRSDWAVLTLNEPAKNVVPIKISPSRRTMRKGDQVLQVSPYSSDFEQLSFGPCNVLASDVRVKGSPHRIPAAVDCAADEGASGSGQYLKNADGQWELLGIVSAIPDDHQNGETADVRTGRFSGTATIQGELWEELNRRANESN